MTDTDRAAAPPDADEAQLCGFRRLAVVTTVGTLLLIAVGGAVRATDSGLACPDWPRCFGLWIPPAGLHIWLEHSHRLLAGVVGLLVLALVLWALARHRHDPRLLWSAVAALALVLAQAALGALVVLRLLQAELVTAHLGMAMVVVACLLYLCVRASRPPSTATAPAGRRLARLATGVAALCFAQILVGGHVTGIAAGLVYTDFPLMGGVVVPAVTDQREAFHVAHRLLAYALAAAVLYLCAQAWRHRRERLAAGAWAAGERWLLWLPCTAGALVLVQIALGVANLWTRASFWTVIPHLAVASWLWSVLVLHALLAARAAAGSQAAPAAGRPRLAGAPPRHLDGSRA